MLANLAVAAALAFHAPLSAVQPRRAPAAAMNWAKAKPIHLDPENVMKSVFTVAKATDEQLDALGVKQWPTWSTAGSAKYKEGVRSPLKVYDTNELSYIISGKMEIIPEETGEPVLVQAGDFVTFPDEFPCYWHVIEEIDKHWFCYDQMGNPDV